MKKCCFIIPYFGKLPNYFQLFLKSCEYNPTFNWIVFTDDKTGFHYPDNVKRVEMTFLELRDLVQSKFDFPISLERPYKLCDYKPAYGYIFSDYISGYKMWGHCDIDTLMGHLEDFITDRDIAIYDKMFTLGHMIIYKNTEENNRLFMKDFRGVSLYRESFTTDKITVFDEEGISNGININQLFLDYGKKVYTVDHLLNINNNRIYFRRTVYKGNNEYPNRGGFEAEPYRKAIYLWNNGYVHRYFVYDGKLIVGNYAYIHLQGRKMEDNNDILSANTFQIIPNKFIRFIHKDITLSNFYIIKKHPYSLDYFRLVLICKIKYGKIILKNLLKS